MSPLVWLEPAGGWALAVAPLVLILYLFHHRQKTRVVTGLFLWGAREAVARGGRRIEWPRARRSLFFDLAAAVLLALALAAPAWFAASGRPVAVVLDDAFSMRARDNVEAARQLVRDTAREARDQGVPFSLWFAGDPPRRAYATDVPDVGLEAALAAWHPSAPRSDPAAAVRALRDAWGGTPIDARFLTNRADTLTGPAAALFRVHRLAGRGGNLALAAVWREPEPGRSDAENLRLDFVNFSDAPATARFEIRELPDHDGQPLHAVELAWTPGERVVVETVVSGRRAQTLNAFLTPLRGEDLIAEDSRVHLPPRPSQRVAYALEDVPDERYYALALEAAGAVPTVPDAPGAPGAPEASADFLVTGSSASVGLVSTLALVAPEAPGTFPGPLVIDQSHPLGRDVRLTDVYWTAADARPAVAGDPSASILVAAGRTPLLTRLDAGRWRLNLIPSRSDVVLRPAWPALFSNLVADTRARLPGLRQTLYAPGEALVWNRLPADLFRAAGLHPLSAPSEPWPLPLRGAARAPSEPGGYELRAGGLGVGVLAVAALFPEASDTRRLAAAASVATDAGHVRGRSASDAPAPRDVGWLPLALALALLAANWRLDLRQTAGER